MNNKPDRKDLKIAALLERISEMTTMYENRDAERRVNLTESEYEIENLREQVQVLSETLERFSEANDEMENKQPDEDPEPTV